jgi:hypothetical protein
MDTPATLTRFLEFAGFSPFFMEMGRRVSPLPRSVMLAFEQEAHPYPFPLQRQAWIAALLREPGGREDPAVWFMRLPLDERGGLVPAARDDLLERLLRKAGENLASLAEGRALQGALPENAYGFRPNAERLAVFHAKTARLLGRAPSDHFEAALAYLRDPAARGRWAELPFQGLADLAARIDQPEVLAAVCRALPDLPAAPYSALCHCLENEALPKEAAEVLGARLERLLENGSVDPGLVAATLRGLSQGRAGEIRRHCLLRVLEHPVSRATETLAAIGARAWESLREPAVCRAFLERLSESSGGQAAFDLCMTDLLFMADLRPTLVAAMRDPARSEAFSRALGGLFSGLGAAEPGPQASS